jgi:hypothetical protein
MWGTVCTCALAVAFAVTAASKAVTWEVSKEARRITKYMFELAFT